jgi:hypothetical protein
MKEFIDNFLTLCKGMMQPLLTIVMAIVFFSYAALKLFTPDQVWQVVVGVIVFWFGYTAFKFGTGNGTDESPKADSPVTGDPVITPMGAVQGWGECENCGDPAVPVTAYKGYTPPAWQSVARANTAPSANIKESVVVLPPTDAVNQIINDTEPENQTGLAMKFKDKMIYLWNDMGPAMQVAYLDQAITLAKDAWLVFIGTNTGQNAPTRYEEMEPENIYYGALKKACGDKWNPTASRGAIDILHDLLKFQQTGGW